MLKTAAALVALILALPALAAELRVPLPNRDDLVIDVPDGWHGQVQRPRADLPPTVAITGPNAATLQVLVTPLWPTGGAKAPTPDDIRSMVQRSADRIRPRAVEPELKLHDLDATGKVGYYFSATDAAPEPGGFKSMSQGAVGMGELRVTFTILVNGEPAEPTSQALALVRSMRRAPGQKAP
ncbi:hypothetical protein ACG04R_03195 [Roseateles sp. BYS78W]|uniref:Lipoprotein LpqN n=1 Tax=Pelomonas candidula TaxID=3299025 RepID=A0ABW7H6Y3_9BURK